MTSLSASAPHIQTRLALVLAVAMAATVGGALAFQHIGGYLPCKLCYEQRIPYYVGAPVMFAAFLASLARLPQVLVRGLFLAGAGLMAWGAYMGIYHSGVEWGWWPGPTDCGMVAPSPDTGANGVLDSLNAIVPPSCDKAALRILGLSLAGWNAIIALVLGLLALRGALASSSR